LRRSAVSTGFQTRLAARVLAALFAAGASLATLTAVLPQTTGVNKPAMGALIVCAFVIATLSSWQARRASLGMLRVGACLGSTMITVGAYFSSVGSGSLSFLYLWVAMYASYFFTRRQAARQVAYVGLVYGVLLAAEPQSRAFATWWLVGMGSLVVASVLIIAMRERGELLIARMYDAARIDPQTELSNRRGFRELLDMKVERARRASRSLTVLVGNLDHFRQVDDRTGDMGSHAPLRRVARLLREGKREADMVARAGDTEFALILPDTAQDAGCALAERLRCALREEFAEDPIPITISFGLATYPDHGETSAALLRAADEALHAAETGGCDQTVPHSPALRGMLRARNDAREIEAERFVAVMLDLADAVDLRFSGSARHSETVGRYTELMALELGLSDARVRRIRLAGLLHDIGKVGVPDSILRKQGPLTDEEFTVIRRHPELGAQILEHPSLTDVREWVAAHHERPDGRGYPLGLSDEELSIEPRIIAVADAYEAMTSDRDYRDSIGYAPAQEELRRCAGTQFDPRVVEALLTALRAENEHVESRMLVASLG
jgi:diguanylate cyclase (GGDEF)-like protein/putative nucleotidyltransferase with HDIG domain